jgi:hypothetical protein
VADYFQSEQAREIASQLLAMPSDIAEGEEAAWLLPFPEEVQQRLAPLLNVDRAAFADSYERQLQDCRRAAVREKLQRRKAELRELIARADGDDKIELMQEFTRLKKQLN